jgi:hypothetical protein
MIADCLQLLVSYLLLLLVLWVTFFLFYKNGKKAALMASVFMALFFFFGAFQDLLKSHLPALHHYKILLPIYFVVAVTALVYIKLATLNFSRLFLFVNLLLSIYLLLDVAGAFWRNAHTDQNRLAIYKRNEDATVQFCPDCPNPDIYFLVFDEYASTGALKEALHYDNSHLDSFLLQQGFFLQRNSHSNYNFTPFSMASILNMDYLNGLKNPDACTVEDYANCQNLIRENRVIHFLSGRSYDIVNYSIFDLAGNPAMVEETLLPVKTRLISDQTLWSRVLRDLGWEFYSLSFVKHWLNNELYYKNLSMNNRLLDAAKKETQKKSTRPRFVYVHLMMPHYPFYYDKNLQPIGPLTASLQAAISTDPGYYTGYIPYANSRLKELVAAIKSNTDGKAVIVLMGDHGFRSVQAGYPRFANFQNLNAVYIPGKQYQNFSDSLTGVNQFRVLFNSLFKQSFPIIGDSVIYLHDKAAQYAPTKSLD